MNKTEKVKLEKALKTYFKEIHEIYTGSTFREESFYPTFKKFFEEYFRSFQKEVEATVELPPV